MAKQSEHFFSLKQLKIMTQIININNVQTITSLEIAELTGKQHKNLMRDIRKMEIAWEKICGLKFELTSRTIVQPNGGTREVPCYQLTKTECLYIATKFNDEQRAKLVLRWEELELERLDFGTDDTAFLKKDTAVINEKEQCLSKREPCNPCLKRLPALQVQKKILAMADEIIGGGLRLLNEPAEDTLTATQVAKTFNMTTYDFNAILRDMGIQYRRDGHWNISDDLADRNLTRLRTHVSYSLKGVKKVKVYMTWTMDGVRFLNAKLGYPNF